MILLLATHYEAVSCLNFRAIAAVAEVVVEVIEMIIQSMAELEGWYVFDLDLTGQSWRLTATNYAY